jgi:hypothetical protein
LNVMNATLVPFTVRLRSPAARVSTPTYENAPMRASKNLKGRLFVSSRN